MGDRATENDKWWGRLEENREANVDLQFCE